MVNNIKIQPGYAALFQPPAQELRKAAVPIREKISLEKPAILEVSLSEVIAFDRIKDISINVDKLKENDKHDLIGKVIIVQRSGEPPYFEVVRATALNPNGTLSVQNAKGSFCKPLDAFWKLTIPVKLKEKSEEKEKGVEKAREELGKLNQKMQADDMYMSPWHNNQNEAIRDYDSILRQLVTTPEKLDLLNRLSTLQEKIKSNQSLEKSAAIYREIAELTAEVITVITAELAVFKASILK